jgi:hypothetical protein
MVLGVRVDISNPIEIAQSFHRNYICHARMIALSDSKAAAQR